MQDSLFNLTNLTTDQPFIQALKEPDLLKDAYILLTLLLLSVIILVKVSKNIQFSGTYKRLFVEEETYSAYRKQSRSKLMSALLDINVLVQLTFLIFFLFREELTFFSSDVLTLISILGFLFVLFILRILSFSILKWLTTSKVNADYFWFTHFNAVRVLSFFFLIMNLLVLAGNVLPFKIILFTVVGLFYAWLILRYLFIGVRYGVLRNLYFFIYLCTLEIAPILILFKLGLLS